MFSERLEFLQNNFYSYGEYALVGTKGYCYEGKDTIEHFEKLRSREIERLRVSLEMAKKAGYQKFTGMIFVEMRQRIFYAFSCYSSSYQHKYKERFRTKRAKPFLIWLIEVTHISPDQFLAADNDRLLRRIPAQLCLWDRQGSDRCSPAQMLH